MKRVITITVFLFFILVPGALMAQPEPAKPAPRYDLSVIPVLFTVGYAHLDTEWRWDYEETINKFLRSTLDENFTMLEKYKPYVFTFSGARRYKMMKEYYPEKFERLKKYVSQGRWFVGGSSVDECDANVPSPESIIRQVLYGNGYFRSEFAKESVDFLLPDCFGFQAHLPSALAHAGVKGFSTQKLGWGSAIGIPFNIGNWIGPDGNGVIAALNATDYTGKIEKRLDTVRYWVDRVMENGRKYEVFADYRYYGVGDVGGSPRESDIKNAVGSLDQADSKIKVYLSSSDQLFRDLDEAQKKRLPTYTGDLLLTQHSAGSLTSQSYMKRWNRKNEQLVQATEPMAVMADWLGSLTYPQAALNRAWWLVLGNQMHDILPGTSIPKAYEYAWNDEVLSLNQFSSSLESSAGAVIKAIDTRGKGKSVVVYNPLAIARKDVVEAEINFPEGTPESVKVIDPENKEIPVQILSTSKNSVRILFMANVPSFGLVCYDIQPAATGTGYKTGLSTGKNILDNEFYKVTINENGDISSIIDKKAGREVLSAPALLEFLYEHPAYWPAWNMDWSDRQRPPVDYVKGPAKISLVENGPVRATFRIERNARNSNFIQFVSLAAGEEALFIKNLVKWQSKGVSLKASFPLTANNPVATYNLGLGTIERANNDEKKYEVPSREWLDLTDKSGNFGVTILEDCKFGSDKPNDKTVRLTLLYTPATNSFHDQATQDWGTHEFTYGIYSHKNDWRSALSEWQGRTLNQPLRAFQVSQHPGYFGKTFSFARLSTPQVDIRALKKAESGNLIIVRLQELLGKELLNGELGFASKIINAYEVDGQERKIGEAVLKNGKLLFDMNKFGIRSYAVQVEPPLEKFNLPDCTELPIAFDQDVVTSDKNKRNGRFDAKGLSIPSELFPETLVVGGISFKLGPKGDGQNNVMSCKGQKIILPKTGNYNRLYILAAALTDTSGVFKAGVQKINLHFQAFSGNIGQADRREWDKYGRIKKVEKGFIKPDEVAWFSTHLHIDTANVPYQYGYLYKYAMDVTPATGIIQLPENDAIKIFALTVADNSFDQVRPCYPLSDDFSGRTNLLLNLPPKILGESVRPTGSISMAGKGNLNDLPARITMKDYADLHQPNGVTVSYFFSEADTSFKSLTNGMNLSALNDGMFELLPGDSLNDKWSENGVGRIFMDLQQEVELDSIHVFASLNPKRGPEFFSVWAIPGNKMPDLTGDPATKGWTCLAVSEQEEIWGGAKAVYTIIPDATRPRNFRYLMWISENSGMGPYYYREIDVFEKQK
ncbi:MAG: glycoside hydrolase family 38 C-terminal domain-containing protein [bacterium]